MLLDESTVEALREPVFRTRMPLIFDPMFDKDARYSAPHAVISGPLDSPELRVVLYGGLTQGLSPSQPGF